MTTALPKKHSPRPGLRPGPGPGLGLLGLLLAAPLLALACDAGDESLYSEQREPCAEHNPLRNAYFGELHSHTGFSFDAHVYGNHFTPDDVYRFALGEPLALEPFDANGQGTRVVQLARPLDFAMVTDHAEFLGEVGLCTTPGSAGYDNGVCTSFRAGGDSGVTFFGTQTSILGNDRFDLCDDADPECFDDMLAQRWQAIQASAEAFYDRSSECSFVTFVGYEYTNSTDVVNLHRNVMFRNANVIPRPVTYYEAPTITELWEGLRDGCLEADTGCDVMSLGHNSNLSNGQYFQLYYDGVSDPVKQREVAELRARLEPLVEVFQHKGDSECRNGFTGTGGDEDPLCDNEKQWPEDAEDCGDDVGTGGMRLWGCVSRLDFIRNALKAGLAEEQRIGVNPYKFGLIASTDTHNSIAGKVSEHDFPGHVGEVDDTPEKRLGEGTLTHDTVINNPGGLTGVWAEERSRDSIFDALRRREVFATSGPRIKVRLFGGWGLADTLCGDPEWVATAYDTGVPMGQDLPERPASASAPSFVIWAEADPGVPDQLGVPLQRMQIIKGWVDAEGEPHEQVYDVAGNPDNDADVDLLTCEPTGTGDDTLCTVWTDPDFDLAEHAFYYVRVVQNPTCRWSTYDCLGIPEADRPAACTDPGVPQTVQDRAWSSPIWYTPQ
ncbi:MAG: DUF3604 domain-containing protein [bacterium]